jgi:hypothetical protein
MEMPVQVRVKIEPAAGEPVVGNEAVMQVRDAQHIQVGNDYVFNKDALEQVVVMPDKGEIVITNLGIVGVVHPDDPSAAVPKSTVPPPTEPVVPPVDPNAPIVEHHKAKVEHPVAAAAGAAAREEAKKKGG